MHLSYAESVWIKASIKCSMLRLSGEAQLVHLREKEQEDVASPISPPSIHPSWVMFMCEAGIAASVCFT